MGTEKSDDALTPNYDAALEFLRTVARRVHLVAINPNQRGQIKGKLFLAEGTQRFDDMRAFIEEWNARKHWNVYFTTGTVRRDLDCAKKPKASDNDIEVVTMFKVDLDPSKVIPKDWTGTPEEFVEHQRARILASLTSDLPKGVAGPPTIVLDSGGGRWGLWFFGLQYDIQNEAERPLMVARNEHLIDLYRAHFRDGGVVADGVGDLSRICRLVGTVNWPDKKKAAAGRSPRLASVDESASNLERRYGPNQFDPPEGASAAPRSNGVAVTIDTGNVKHFASVDDISELRDAPQCRVVVNLGIDPDNPDKFGPSRSEWLFFACCEMVRRGMSDEDIYAVITDPAFGISASVLDKGSNVERYALKQIRKARVEAGELVLDPSDPMPSAESFVSVEAPELILYNSDWLDYDGAAYREVEDGMIESRLYRFLQRAKRREMKDKQWENVPFKPTSAKVSDVLRALEAVTIRPRDKFEPPCWIAEPGPPPREIISCANGLLHLPTGSLLTATPSFFTRNALEIAYDPNAPTPSAWLAFLAQLWPNDRESIDVLQEVFGYLLVPDTSQQKVFFLKGPPRSGKGTIARILRMLVGALNVTAPSLPSLGTRFGLEPLVGKSLAIVSDARDSGRMEVQAAIAENLLRISGEDLVSIERKFKAALETRLATRFLIMSNLRPKLPDASGALANRFVPLVMTESFLGREDPALTDRLLAELPGVLNWAIDGWRRLHARGHFKLSASGRALLVELIEDGAPVMSFVREECELDPLAQIESATLYEAYSAWRLIQGMSHVDSRVFGKDLTAAFPKVASSRPNIGGQRVYVYTGIRLGRSDVDRARTLLDAWARLPGTDFGPQHEAAFDRLWGSESFYSGGA